MKRAFALLAVLGVLPAVALATTVRPMSVEDLTRSAAVVVKAQAGESWSQWNPQHSIIFTYTRYTVLKPLKGGVAGEIIVKQPGGIVGPVGQRVPGVRFAQPGEQAVLFLRPSAAADGSHVIVGLMQGNFLVYRSRTGVIRASNGVPNVSQLQGSSLKVYTGASLSLEELELRVGGAQR